MSDSIDVELNRLQKALGKMRVPRERRPPMSKEKTIAFAIVFGFLGFFVMLFAYLGYYESVHQPAVRGEVQAEVQDIAQACQKAPPDLVASCLGSAP